MFRTNNLWCIVAVVCALFHMTSRAHAQDISDAFKWDVKCEARGCMLFLDVLHGAAGQTPPDPKDSHQYISVMVAVDRVTRSPAYLAFHFPPDADERQGFFVAFAKDQQIEGKWQVKPDTKPLQLGFDSCDKESCVARMKEGKVLDEKGGFIDLLQSFQQEDHLWLLYTKGGQPIRTLIPLGPFRSAYQHVLTSDLAPQR